MSRFLTLPPTPVKSVKQWEWSNSRANSSGPQDHTLRKFQVIWFSPRTNTWAWIQAEIVAGRGRECERACHPLFLMASKCHERDSEVVMGCYESLREYLSVSAKRKPPCGGAKADSPKSLAKWRQSWISGG